MATVNSTARQLRRRTAQHYSGISCPPRLSEALDLKKVAYFDIEIKIRQGSLAYASGFLDSSSKASECA